MKGSTIGAVGRIIRQQKWNYARMGEWSLLAGGGWAAAGAYCLTLEQGSLLLEAAAFGSAGLMTGIAAAMEPEMLMEAGQKLKV